MTLLEQLIRDRVTTTTADTFSRAIDDIAHEMARDIIRDPVWRAQMRALTEKAFSSTLHQLTTNGTKRRRAKRGNRRGGR